VGLGTTLAIEAGLMSINWSRKESDLYVDSQGTLAPSRAYSDRRREPRYVSSVPIVLQRFVRSRPFLTRGVSLDVSIRGMSALVCGALRVGETVLISVPLLHTPVEMLATVRHSTDARCGFEFRPLSPIAQQGIQAWIQELEKHEESRLLYPNAAAAKGGSG
jgi:hypothetical protein